MPLLASAILFDLDGVLADSTLSVNRAWSAWARRVGLEPERLLPLVHGRRRRGDETALSHDDAHGRGAGAGGSDLARSDTDRRSRRRTARDLGSALTKRPREILDMAPLGPYSE